MSDEGGPKLLRLVPAAERTSPEREAAKAELIQGLRDTLAAVEDGRIVAAAIGYVRSDGSVGCAWNDIGGNRHALTSAASGLWWRLSSATRGDE